MQTNPHEPNIASFYHLTGRAVADSPCQGMACFAARHLDPDRWHTAQTQAARIYCLGKCYAAPAAGGDTRRPGIEIHAAQPVVLKRVVAGGARTVQSYTGHGGYTALAQALRTAPDAIVQAIEHSGLRGRGGAGFPTGRKWRAVFQASGDEKFVVANADEGDPGAYIDRFIMEDDPHALIEALVIAGYAVGASKACIYLRSEYPEARIILKQALADARQQGYLGENILDSRFSFDIELIIGQGSYICGEETALLNSIEGRRPEVRVRPPYPTESGLFDKPTLIDNVETLAAIPWIVQHGAEAYRTLGFSNSRGTKLVSLNSLFNRPGLYEIEFGMPVRHIVEQLGGGLKTGKLKGVIIGGPLAGMIPPQLLDTPFGHEELHAIGAAVGHGGVVVFDEHTSIAALIHHIFSFGAYESCGKCTPCRLGSRRIEQIFEKPLQTGKAPAIEKAEWEEIVAALAHTSLCGLGTGLAEFAHSIERYYTQELTACFA
ncbi:MAG: complex I 51 kDa subunit family protein [Pseudomonadota bacterium]